MKTEKKPIERVHTFICCDKAMTKPELLAHIKEAHGFTEKTPCKRSMTMALDGSDFYHNSFEWSIPCGDKTIKVTEIDKGPRGSGDLLYQP